MARPCFGLCRKAQVIAHVTCDNMDENSEDTVLREQMIHKRPVFHDSAVQGA